MNLEQVVEYRAQAVKRFFAISLNLTTGHSQKSGYPVVLKMYKIVFKKLTRGISVIRKGKTAFVSKIKG